MNDEEFFPQLTYLSITRNETAPFTVKQLQRKLSRREVKFSSKELRYLLNYDQNIILLENDCYITKAGLCTGRPFGIKPTEFEIKNNILIPGTRCVPFVEQEIFSHEIAFWYGGKPMLKKTISLQYSEAIKYYGFIGAEFLPHYLANDPANSEIGDDLYYSDVSTVNLTVIDMEKFYKRYDFQYGDWLVCQLTDWNESMVHVCPEIRHELSIFQQKKFDEEIKEWEDKMVECFKDVCDHCGVPKSIEEQIFLTYLIYISKSPVWKAWSFEKALLDNPELGYIDFGVESRIWPKNKDLTALGRWVIDCDNKILNVFTYINQEAIILHDSVITAYAKKILFDELSKKTITKLDFFDENEYLTQEIKDMLYDETKIRVEEQRKKYNMFTDFNIAETREKALAMYNEMYKLFVMIHIFEVNFEDFNQMDLVLLVQSFVQLCKTFDELETQEQLSQQELDSYSNAVEGMEFAFEESKDSIKQVISTEIKKKKDE